MLSDMQVVQFKGVGDVFAARWRWVFTCSSQVTRASGTCLLGLEQGVDEFFAVVKGVDDVLAGAMEQGVQLDKVVDVPVVVRQGSVHLQFLDKVYMPIVVQRQVGLLTSL